MRKIKRFALIGAATVGGGALLGKEISPYFPLHIQNFCQRMFTSVPNVIFDTLIHTNNLFPVLQG